MAVEVNWDNHIVLGCGVLVSAALLVVMGLITLYKLSCCEANQTQDKSQDKEKSTDSELNKNRPSRYQDTPLAHIHTPQEYETPVSSNQLSPELPTREYLNDREFVRSLHESELPDLPRRVYLVDCEFMKELNEGATDSKRVPQDEVEQEMEPVTGNNLSELEPEDKVYQPLIPPRLGDEHSTYQSLVSMSVTQNDSGVLGPDDKVYQPLIPPRLGDNQNSTYQNLSTSVPRNQTPYNW